MFGSKTWFPGIDIMILSERALLSVLIRGTIPIGRGVVEKAVEGQVGVLSAEGEEY